MQGKEKTVRKEDLARTVSELIEEFGLVRERRFTGKAFKVIYAIQKAITDGLRRGETVTIAGFGSFKLFERRAYRTPITYFQGGRPPQLRHPPRAIITVPTKTIVKFTPSKTILKELNRYES